METNWIALVVAAVIPLVIGGIWYHPKVMGTAWMKASGITEEKIRSGNMAKIFGLTFLFSLMLATFMNVWVIHQYAINSILMNEPGFGDPNSEVSMYIADFMARYGTNFRTFSHGATHGVIATLFFALPLLAINAQFERQSWKYILIHIGYWMITLALMGGLICAWV